MNKPSEDDSIAEIYTSDDALIKVYTSDRLPIMVIEEKVSFSCVDNT